MAEPKPKPWWAPDLQTFVVVWLVVTTPILIIFCMVFPPDNSNELLKLIIIGYAITGFGTAVGFAIGTSKSSQSKDDNQSNVMQKLAKANVALSTGTGAGIPAAVTAAAEAAAVPAAEKVAAEAAAKAAPPAADVAAPPAAEAAAPAAAEAAAPAAAEKAVADALNKPRAPTP